MIIESELRQKISMALSDQISLDDLYQWLMARSWNMHQDSSESAVSLAAAVELLFFEQSNGDIDDDLVRENLARLLAPVVHARTLVDRKPHRSRKSI